MDGSQVQFRSPEERAQMRERFAAGRDEAISDEERRRQNRDFVQVYPKGFARIRSLLQQSKSPAPLLLWTFLAEHLDADGGVLVVDQDTLCAELGIGRTTLWRACKFLEEQNALFRLQVGGAVYAYALDPNEVWRSWDSAKETAVFRTKTLVRKSASNNEVVRKMRVMIQEQDRSEVREARDDFTPEQATKTSHDPETGEVKP